jgi:hypothetical protein
MKRASFAAAVRFLKAFCTTRAHAYAAMQVSCADGSICICVNNVKGALRTSGLPTLNAIDNGTLDVNTW